MAGVGRRGGQSPAGAAGPHVGLVSAAPLGPSPLQPLLPCFFLARAGGGDGKASTTNGQTDVYLVQKVLNFNLFSLIFIKYIL